MKTEDIKDILTDFIKESLQANNKYELKDGTALKLNKAIYQIQNHLMQQLENNEINSRLDSKIISSSILNSFSSKCSLPHSPDHYVFPFLRYIYHNFRANRDLLDYIDGFIEVNKDRLTWQDIVITKTGATRCKTNIRFALNTLRDLNLVKSRNDANQRTVMPTIIGQLLVYYFDSMKSIRPNALAVETELSSDGYRYFVGHLGRLKEPLVLTHLLNDASRTFNLSPSNKQKVHKYLHDFIDIILPNVSISERGIKYSKEAIQSDGYKELLAQLTEESFFLTKTQT